MFRSKSQKKGKGEDRERTYWFTDFHYDYGRAASRRVKTVEEGNLVSSLTNDKLHMPVLDLDFDADLLPSSSPGHYHLYLNKPITWEQYKKLLDALFECGFVNEGWYRQAMRENMTVLRKPGVYKSAETFHEALKVHLQKGRELFPAMELRE